MAMYYLQNQVTGEYVQELVKLKNGKYAIYYTPNIKLVLKHWATMRGAEAAMARLYSSGTVPVDMLAVVREVRT